MPSTKTNKAKYLSYKAAWERINRASDCGFHFEVVTLCEGIISDRLLSFVRGTKPDSKFGPKSRFADLIKEWRILTTMQQPARKDGSCLVTAVDKWRDQRNIVVHGMMKSMPGEPPAEVLDFLGRASAAAEEGILLAKEVQTWHKRQLPKKTQAR